MYLNVIPDPPAVPEVVGLGNLGNFGLGQVQLVSPPGLRIPPGTRPIDIGRRLRGMGQFNSQSWGSDSGLALNSTSQANFSPQTNPALDGNIISSSSTPPPTGCPQGSLADALENWLDSLSAELPQDAAVGCGPSNGAPCGSPSEAAGQAMAIGQNYCNILANDVVFGCPMDPACKNLSAAVAPYQARALAKFQSFDPSVWATEKQNAATGQYYGPIQQYTTPGATQGQPTVYGPPVDISTGAPLVSSGGGGGGGGQTAQSQSQPAQTQSSASTLSQPVIVEVPQSSAPQSAPLSLDTSWLTSDVSLFGMNIPVWGIMAAVGGALFLMPRGR